MADEIKDSPVAPAASPVEVAAPSAPETPVEAAPVETKPAEAAPVEAKPVEEAKPEAEQPIEKPAEKPAEEAKKPETLLGSEKKAEEKPAETAKPEEAKPVEEAPVEIPKYELKLPEGVTVDEAKFGDFTKMLGDFETTSKVSHDDMQKLGQQMVDRHLEEMTRYTESLTNAWNKQKNDWKESFLKSPEFANRTDTAVNAAIDAIGIYGGDAAQQTEFRELMEKTGVGNHPAMIRVLSNIMLAKAEPKQLSAPTIPVKANQSKIQKMYGKKS